MTRKVNKNFIKMVILVLLVFLAMIMYQFMHVNEKYFQLVMQLRAPKLIVILIVVFCIGSSTIVFQSLINNNIVTPCLLGMNSLYILLHTVIVFILGTSSIYVKSNTIAYFVDLVVMIIVALILYGYLFRKTGGNVLYVLLAGTVMATLFGSITSFIQRIMSPNEFATLETTLVASFSNVNSSNILLSVVIILLVIIAFWRDVKYLDVIALGKENAINLGVDYDRVIRRLLIGVTIFISIATAMVGPISFLGLIIANIGRQLLKTYKHVVLIWGTVLIGMFVLLFGQGLIEHVFSYTTTIAVFINITGGIYFLYLVLIDKK